MDQKGLPSSYPFLEPCLGCFENALQALSEQPGNPVFFSNGDITVNRFLQAMSRLVPEAKVSVYLFSLFEPTARQLDAMVLRGAITSAAVYCSYIDPLLEKSGYPYPNISICDGGGCCMNLLHFRGKERNLLISGYAPQGPEKGALHFFQIYNDTESRSLIARTVERHYQRFKFHTFE